jgi:hypothetical protein
MISSIYEILNAVFYTARTSNGITLILINLADAQGIKVSSSRHLQIATHSEARVSCPLGGDAFNAAV